MRVGNMQEWMEQSSQEQDGPCPRKKRKVWPDRDFFLENGFLLQLPDI